MKYQCEICPKQFYDKALYEGHMNSHFGCRTLGCKKCEKTFVYKTNLKRHEQSCKGKDSDNNSEIHSTLVSIFAVCVASR